VIGLDGGPLATATIASRNAPMHLDRAGLAGSPAVDAGPAWTVSRADGAAQRRYHELRRAVFVEEQALFAGSDRDDVDGATGTIVLVARDRAGDVIGGVRLAPVGGDDRAGWWSGSRLVVRADHRRGPAVGRALVRAACATAEEAGALRFDASVQPASRRFFERIGWITVGEVVVAGRLHVDMRWPIGRAQRLAEATKAPLAALLHDLGPLGDLGPRRDLGPLGDLGRLRDLGPRRDLGGVGWVGDDAAPVDGSDLLAACDAIMASMVERDPEWAGWCGVLVNVNDLSAMGADPVALLDAVAAPTVAAAARVLDGLRRASAAWGVPIIGGHTQIGVPSALAVTALGRTSAPVPGGGGRPGDDVSLSVDLAGGWRPGYAGRQWDSTTSRAAGELRAMGRLVARMQPTAAKDVSMAGIIGTLGMLAEASGCGAELDVASVPQPAGTVAGDWLTCFPGFAMVTADRPGRTRAVAASPVTSGVVGRLVAGSGVALVWPDGRRTVGVAGAVTGLGPAGG
jgi:putative N-acetyltransferase (TIGR04045 family)